MKTKKGKFLSFLLIPCLASLLVACTTEKETSTTKSTDETSSTIGYSYYHVHLALDQIYHLNITSYYANATGILDLKLTNGTAISVQSGAVIYHGDTCPLCGWRA